jgi:hypothetical protein
MQEDNFEALEAQFSGSESGAEAEKDRLLDGTRNQAEIAAAFYQKLREQNVGRVSAAVITASMTQAFIVGTLMKPDS